MCEVMQSSTDQLVNTTTDNTAVDSVITDAEAALYDRQIRLWGASAQKKLRMADVLMAGINGVGSEIVKNIVLSGINSITLLDDQLVTTNDSLSNLFTKRQLGKNRAEVARDLVQSLNPMVAVKSECGNIADKDKDYLSAFQVVIVSNYDKQTMFKVNQFCNELKIKFFATAVWGLFGFTFTDLGSEHTYVTEEDVKREEEIIGDNNEPLKKKVKLDDTVKQIVEKKVSFVSLETALAVKAGKSGYGLTKRTSSSFIITHILLEFYDKHSRYPSPDSRDNDIKELAILEKQVIERLGVNEDIISNKVNDWHKHVFGELSPVCAVVGGVLAQDVIRVISEKDTPIRNFFLFDGISCNGNIESIGK
ncbi:SUMO-activating enzyme subunit 1-like [Oppia nitens]|uniref:SUMO-activating enzyme subunit 1-like n=1 Tax=Oppia nitens TaxID=1686743 RepID=UPI0023DC1B08|nr:SUMO-activating enzyme subunit 1-like [Oppia nitens]